MTRYRLVVWMAAWFAILLLSGCACKEMPCVGYNAKSTCECCRSGPVSPCYTGGCCKVVCRTCPPRIKCPVSCKGGKQNLINRLANQDVQVVELGDCLTIILYTDNCFEQGTANIDFCCNDKMDNIVALLRLYGKAPIKVTGYTDNIGDCCGKHSLARHLADSVVAYLWTHGIPLNQLAAVTRPCNYPIATTHTVCGNAFNRRVEITVRKTC